MSEHTKTPWVIADDMFICGVHKGMEYAVCDMQPAGYDYQDGEVLANARHIVRCVNNFDRLVEALESAADCLEDAGYMGAYEQARALLAELERKS